MNTKTVKSAMTRDELVMLLKQNRIRPSFTRMKILEYLVNNKTHPPAEEIYSKLAPEVPTLSRTTVYNTLSLFAQSGLVKVLALGENEKRFDYNTHLHGHFRCAACGWIYDFALKSENIEAKGLEGFSTEERDVYFKGTCKTCLSK